jgi:hypothetical protein
MFDSRDLSRDFESRGRPVFKLTLEIDRNLFSNAYAKQNLSCGPIPQIDLEQAFRGEGAVKVNCAA